MIFIKMDIATRHNRSVLGINVQFFDPEMTQICIYTLSLQFMEGNMIQNIY